MLAITELFIYFYLQKYIGSSALNLYCIGTLGKKGFVASTRFELEILWLRPYENAVDSIMVPSVV